MPARIEKKAGQTVPGESWGVVVVYEDAPTRDRALLVCDDLVHKFWSDVEFDISWWRESFLTDPEIAQAAAMSATNADMIIFSEHAEGEMAAPTMAWIQTWLKKRAPREGALIGLIGTQDNARSAAPARENCLRQIAKRGGLDYLSSVFPIRPPGHEGAIESIHHRAEQMTSVLDQILHQPFPPDSSTRQTIEN